MKEERTNECMKELEKDRTEERQMERNSKVMEKNRNETKERKQSKKKYVWEELNCLGVYEVSEYTDIVLHPTNTDETSHTTNRLVGRVVKASASRNGRSEDRFPLAPWELFRVESYQ